MGSKGNKMDSIQALKDKIIPFPPTMMEAMGIAAEEKSIFANYRIVPIALLVKAEWNYKVENVEMSAKLKANMKRVGQIENLHTRELHTGYYEVVNGNHRLDQLVALGNEYALVYHHGEISLAEAQRIALETNETKFGANEIKLAKIITELTKEFEIADLTLTMPYTQEHMEDLVQSITFDYAAYAAEFTFDPKSPIPNKKDPDSGEEKPTILNCTPEEYKEILKIVSDNKKDSDGKRILIGVQIKIRAKNLELTIMNQLMNKLPEVELNSYSMADFLASMGYEE